MKSVSFYTAQKQARRIACKIGGDEANATLRLPLCMVHSAVVIHVERLTFNCAVIGSAAHLSGASIRRH